MAVATVTTLTDSARIGMVALIVFLLVGFALLVKVPYPAYTRHEMKN
jgi:UMF1 family MFS transporter